MKHLVRAGLSVLILASLASASADPAAPPPADPAILESPAEPAEDGLRAPGGAEYRIPVGGCSALVRCPTGGYVRCVSWFANGCVSQPNATPPWVACDGVVTSCPGPLIP